MSEIDDGGPAFSRPDYTGMTLREWYAGMALQVITKNISLEDFVNLKPYELAESAFLIADAMIRAGKVEK